MKKNLSGPLGQILVLVSLLLLLAGSAQAASSTLNPTLEAFVTTGPSGNLVNSNYGGAGALSVAARGSAQVQGIETARRVEKGAGTVPAPFFNAPWEMSLAQQKIAFSAVLQSAGWDQ
jgi:hypothetical protein